MAHQYEGSGCDSILNTGNVLKLNPLSTQAEQSTTTEVLEGIKHTLNLLFSRATVVVQDAMEAGVGGVEAVPKFECPEERKRVAAGLKVFVRHYDRKLVAAALAEGRKALGTEKIDSVVLAGENAIPLHTIKAMWKVLEEFCSQGNVARIGISDIEMKSFVKLYKWAKVSNPKAWKVKVVNALFGVFPD